MKKTIIVAAFIGLAVGTADAQAISSDLRNFVDNATSAGEIIGESVHAVTQGNCNVQGILGDAFFGKYSGEVDFAIQEYETGGSGLIEEAKNPAFARRVNMQGWRFSSDLDLSHVRTKADLIRMLGQLALNTASDLKAVKDHHDADALSRAITESSEMTRLILAIVDVPYA